ncbi:MAG: sigma-54-dependent Fis family transcriptional regulator [Desulfuromonadaceae bacterium]|nr:sigma-54-dependent Fis family transcriptional regulator [Desulfuromonadaceae bacterium]
MQQPKQRILLVDDEEGICFTLGTLLKKEGYLVDVSAGLAAARSYLQATRYDLAFIDIMLAGESGLDLLREIKDSAHATQVVMFTGCPQVESAAEAVRLGAFDYITKPVRYETLIAVTRHALGTKALNDERERYRANMDAILRTVTDSIVMIDRDGRLAQFNATAERICGYRHNLIGLEAVDIQLGCGGKCRVALLDSLNNNASRALRRIECHTPSGKTRIVSLTATPVTESDGTLNGAVAVIRDETELVELERSLRNRGRFHGIIGASAPMQRVYRLVESLADVPTTVLINGESGTGKELVAAALHGSGVRSRGPFVKVNCSALSEHLLESELFGHVRGAFTGAISDKVGRFQKAHGGTLFLDEIGDISPAIQMRLLRVLQESEFERVGESSSIKVDVRIVAATNQSLADMVSQGTFRQDLYYRLNVIRIELPPLRERLDDLELLVAHFIAYFNNKLSKVVTAVSENVMSLFRSYSWPGNVRELEHVIEHACILCKATIITVSDLPQDLLGSMSQPIASKNTQSHSLPLPSTPAVKLSLAEALSVSGGNKARAARLLGISRMTLYRQLEGSE